VLAIRLEESTLSVYCSIRKHFYISPPQRSVIYIPFTMFAFLCVSHDNAVVTLRIAPYRVIHSLSTVSPFAHLMHFRHLLWVCTRVYPKVSGLAAESYFVSQSSEFCRHNTLCCFSTSVCCCYFFIDSVRKVLDTHSYLSTSVTFQNLDVGSTDLSQRTPI
jgi:hypothetical protein